MIKTAITIEFLLLIFIFIINLGFFVIGYSGFINVKGYTGPQGSPGPNIAPIGLIGEQGIPGITGSDGKGFFNGYRTDYFNLVPENIGGTGSSTYELNITQSVTNQIFSSNTYLPPSSRIVTLTINIQSTPDIRIGQQFVLSYPTYVASAGIMTVVFTEYENTQYLLAGFGASFPFINQTYIFVLVDISEINDIQTYTFTDLSLNSAA